MKRTWTKKVKSLPKGTVSKVALERQLQPHPKVKVRIFRTSAAMIGLTVSIGTPNLLLVQAAQVPESISSLALIEDAATPETIEKTPAIEPYRVMPVVEVVAYQAANLPLGDRRTPAQEITTPSYNLPAPVVQASVAPADFTPEEPSSQIAAPLPVVEQDVRAIIKQHQQATSLAPSQTINSPLATASQKRAIAQIKASQTPQEQVVEVVVPPAIEANSSEIHPPQVAVSSEANSAWTAKQRLLVNRLRTPENPASLIAKPAEVAVNSEANSAWTAKQRLLVNRLRTPENPASLIAKQEEQVSNKVDLALPATTPSQEIANTAPIAATSNNMEFEAQPLPTEVTVLPTTAPNNQQLVAPANESQILPVIAATTAQSTPKLKPVFVLPEASVAPQVDTNSIIEGKEVEEEVAAQNTSAELKNYPPAQAEVPSVNEPIIISSTTSEYQVKPGDTLTNIASAHHLSLPEIADFNKLPNPNLLLVDQRIKLPTLTSMKTKANVAVLPPIEKVEPLANANSLSEPTLQSVTKVELVSEKLTPAISAPAYTGVGGSVEGEAAEAKPLKQTALNDLQVQYAQKLKNDVQKLQQKYYAQNNSANPLGSAQAIKGDRLPVAIKPNLESREEPVNPDFRVAQTFQDLKPIPQKRLPNKVNYSAPANIRGKVATAPVSDNNSEQFSEQQVIPELPPLAPALKYLPEPSSGAPFKGYIWPARGALTSKYGWRWGRMHRGIDIAAPVGTPVFASAPGVVIKSGWNKGGYGNLVDIQHSDGTLTRYAHNYRLLVQPGQFVEQGQQISLMGNTGRSTGPHLHFEVHHGGKGAVNPIALLPKVR